MKIGAQGYTIRDFVKTPDDIEVSIKKLKEIGYNYLQVSGFGAIPPEQLRKITDKYEMEICVTHTSPDKILNDTKTVIEEHKILGCKHIGIGALPGHSGATKQTYIDFANNFEKPARLIEENGLKLHYHNHAFEFEHFEDFIPFDYLIKNTSLNFILDTYWIQYAGKNPSDVIRRLSGRINCVHLKDMTIFESNQRMAPVYEGNMDFDSILKAISETGIEYAMVEQDHCYEKDPFLALKISFDNITRKIRK